MQSVGDADPASLAGVDLVLLGCWTSGLFVVAQHPDEPWLAFVRELPAWATARVGAVHHVQAARPASMFATDAEPRSRGRPRIDLELKSRNGHLSDADRLALDRLIGVG